MPGDNGEQVPNEGSQLPIESQANTSDELIIDNGDKPAPQETPIKAPDSLFGFFAFFIDTLRRAHFKETIKLVAGVGMFSGIAFLLVIGAIKLLSPEKLTIGDSTLTFSTHNNRNTVQALLPSSVVWLDTKIDMEPNTAINTKADGRVHLAIHYVVNSAQSDSIVKYPWSDPDGQGSTLDTQELVLGDTLRDGQKLCPSAKYAQLLAYVGPEKLDKNNPWPKDEKIQVLGKEGVLVNESDKKQRVWLAINDIILDNSEISKRAYLLNEDVCKLAKRYNFKSACDTQALIESKKQWNAIKKKKNWNIWYDDNMGTYIVEFDIFKASKKTANYCKISRQRYLEEFLAVDVVDKTPLIKQRYTTSNLADIKPKAKKLAAKNESEEQVLVIFDIDNTILAMENELGSDQWYGWQKELDVDDSNKIHDLLAAQRALFFIQSMRPTELGVQTLINELNASQYQTLSITARGHQSRVSTYRELDSHNIVFNNKLFDDSARFEFNPINIDESRKVVYDNHVTYSSGQNKGKILAELLERSRYKKIKSIIFVDDKEYNLTDVEKTFSNLSYDLITFKYTGEDERVKGFDGPSTTSEWCEIRKSLVSLNQASEHVNFNLSNRAPRACSQLN